MPISSLVDPISTKIDADEIKKTELAGIVEMVRKIQQEPQYLLGNPQQIKDLKDNKYIVETDKPNMYSFTDTFVTEMSQSIYDAKDGGTPYTVLWELAQLSIANNNVEGLRATNKIATQLLNVGFTGKNMGIKGKSSEGINAASNIGGIGSSADNSAGTTFDPTGGLVPKNQKLSKLPDPTSIEKFQHKVDAYISNHLQQKEQEKGSTLTDSEKKKLAPLTNRFPANPFHEDKIIASTNVSWYIIEKSKDVNSSKIKCDFVYYKLDLNGEEDRSQLFYLDNITKEEKLYNITGTKALEPLELLSPDFESLPYCADNDLLIQGLPYQEESISDHSDHSFGIINDTQKATVGALRVGTNQAINHGYETSNPFGYRKELSQDLKQGITIVLPDGKIKLIKQEEGEKKTIEAESRFADICNEQRSKGYQMIPNPLWGWELDKSDKLVVVDNPVNYQKIHEEISSLDSRRESKTSSQSQEAMEIVNLHNAIKSYEYRASMPNGTDAKAVGCLTPPPEGEIQIYITSDLYDKSVALLQEKETKYHDNYESHSPLFKELLAQPRDGLKTTKLSRQIDIIKKTDSIEDVDQKKLANEITGIYNRMNQSSPSEQVKISSELISKEKAYHKKYESHSPVMENLLEQPKSTKLPVNLSVFVRQIAAEDKHKSSLEVQRKSEVLKPEPTQSVSPSKREIDAKESHVNRIRNALQNSFAGPPALSSDVKSPEATPNKPQLASRASRHSI